MINLRRNIDIVKCEIIPITNETRFLGVDFFRKRLNPINEENISNDDIMRNSFVFFVKSRNNQFRTKIKAYNPGLAHFFSFIVFSYAFDYSSPMDRFKLYHEQAHLSLLGRFEMTSIFSHIIKYFGLLILVCFTKGSFGLIVQLMFLAALIYSRYLYINYVAVEKYADNTALSKLPNHEKELVGKALINFYDRILRRAGSLSWFKEIVIKKKRDNIIQRLGSKSGRTEFVTSSDQINIFDLLLLVLVIAYLTEHEVTDSIVAVNVFHFWSCIFVFLAYLLSIYIIPKLHKANFRRYAAASKQLNEYAK